MPGCEHSSSVKRCPCPVWAIRQSFAPAGHPL
jgi:hypothetical protein